MLAHAWEAALRVPVLKAFADPVEKNRELAVAARPNLAAGPALAAAAVVMPVLVGRVGGAPVAEGSEELRLQLLGLSARSSIAAATLAVHLRS